MITPQDLADAFNKAGANTVEKVIAVVANLNDQLEMKKIDIEIESISEQQRLAIAPFNDKRLELTNKRTELSEAIKARSV